MRPRIPTSLRAAVLAATLVLPHLSHAQVPVGGAGGEATVTISSDFGVCGKDAPAGGGARVASVFCQWDAGYPAGVPEPYAAASASVGADGRLHAAVELFSGPRPTQDLTSYAGDAYATRWDRLTFAGPVVPRTARLSVVLHGRASGPDVGARLEGSIFGIEGFYTLTSGSTAGADRVQRATWDVPLVGGAVNFALQLFAFARIDALTGTPGGNLPGDLCHLVGGCTSHVYADFGNTAYIEGVAGLDDAGQVIGAGLQLRSASKVAYLVSGGVNLDADEATVAPEPATLALLAVGAATLGAAAGVRRRRAHAGSPARTA